MHEERPPLLEVGLFLSALHACVWIGLALAGGALVGIGVGAAALIHPVALLPAGFLGGLTGIVVAVYVGWCLLTLYACHRVWQGSRGWTWALLVMSILCLTDLGLLSTPARALTIVGIVQLFGARPAPYATE